MIVLLCLALFAVVFIGWIIDFFWPSVVVVCVLFVVALASFVLDGDDQTCRSGEEMGSGLVLSETSAQFILDEPALAELPSTTKVNCTWDGETGGSYAQLIKQFESGPKAWDLALAALQDASNPDTFASNTDDSMYGRTGTTMPTHIVITRIGGLLCEVRITTQVDIDLPDFKLKARDICAQVAA